MSRSGYNDYDDIDNWALIKFRGQVASAIRGRRGHAFLTELRDALDAMPEKRLISHDLQTADGEVCTLGAIGVRRGVPLEGIDPDDERHHDHLAKAFDIAPQLVQEIEWENDEAAYHETPEGRWQRMRRWVERAIAKAEDADQ